MGAKRLLSMSLLAAVGLNLAAASGASVFAKGKLPAPAKKDLCANAFGGSLPNGHGYHWFCSGRVPVKARQSEVFSLQCGPGKFDKRRKYGYWVSTKSLRLTMASWTPVFGELDLSFKNGSSKKQNFEYWESCKGSS